MNLSKLYTKIADDDMEIIYIEYFGGWHKSKKTQTKNLLLT